ncbi:putative tricarboxylic transport membrane protein [Roseovarius nanhaiticus]|uniref:Putative tricarboxylic transport membrane protein n=1 Tax=Roseovarius nanhaiticus TaxID=573024 RepID=A0A1N7FAL3_9RHOB|nr:tripartite tricarboxylate transporter permease [Roseovarius nanhaiticus]SEK58450.1 putative tricarboxylic transport membrane protein [Roseovarius nanhaiticus]SIR97377.1 putative tricarboxylic transport membrane protein [Roseovarius nanhaiticus]
MSIIEILFAAIREVLMWQNLAAMGVGVVGGILIGALPGLTATMGIAILIPLTFTMEPMVALGMVAGIYNGGIYGGAIPAILLGIPGTSSSIPTTFDGVPLAKRGEAGNALRISAWSSAVGGVASGFSLLLLAPPLATVTLLFGPAEYFWVALFGMCSIAILLGADPLKGLISSGLGLLIGTIGIDSVSGHERFTLDIYYLTGGFNLIVLLAGLYGLPPAIDLAQTAISQQIDAARTAIKESEHRFTDWPSLFPTWARSSMIGIVIGILPGVGGTMAAFLSYNETKRADKDPDSFGKGNYKGVAASECGNNADNASALIPTLTLGVPGNAVAAVIMGAFLVHGLQPGPGLFRSEPVLVYAFILQMILTAAILPVLGGSIAVRVFAPVLRLPQALIAPIVVSLSVIGVYSIQNSVFDIYALIGFGLLGYILQRTGFPLAPIVLGVILGPMAEQQLRLALIIARGDVLSIASSPVAMILIALIVLVLALPVVRMLLGRRARIDPKLN